MTAIRCLLWDFGDTLCDERFIWSSGPDWMAIYETFDEDGLGARWSLGEIDTKSFAEALSPRLGRTPDSIVSHMIECCGAIRFYEKTYEFFRERHLPQAIVTVNPDLFTDVIVPLCNFEVHCETIVTSWEEGTDDKRILNQLAIERMGLECEPEAALLIDNKRFNILAWRGVGGAGYHFHGDEAFARDSARGVDTLAGCSVG